MSSREVSIDIQLKKLLDWLISRRICPHNWHEHVPTIRERLSSALRNVSEEPSVRSLVESLDAEQPVDFFLAKDILEALKRLDADTKNVFGVYGSERVNAFIELVDKLWPRQTAYLGDSAQILSRVVVYELPAAKKRVARALQVLAECDKSEKDNLRRSHELYNEYKKACNALDIDPEAKASLRKQILVRLKELPEVYSNVAKKAELLSKAIEFYANFVHALQEETQQSEKLQVLPTLRFLAEKGDVSVYEWRHGEPPLKLDAPHIDLDENNEDDEEKEENNDDNVIDFGDDSDQIDFDIQLESGGDIDWGNLDTTECNEEAIDWSHVEVVGEDAIVVEQDGLAGGTARGEEALSLLDNRNTRALVLDELTELECFIQQRMKEEEASDQMTPMGLTTELGSASVSELSSWLTTLHSMTSMLTSTQVHHLQLIRSSPKYVDRLLDSLRSKKALEERARNNNELVKARRSEAIGDQAASQDRIDRLLASAKRLQKCLEADISKRYNGRKVNILLGL